MRSPKGGFSYYFDLKKIKEYRKVPPEQKLKWLEEINVPANKVFTKAQKKHREKILKGFL